MSANAQPPFAPNSPDSPEDAPASQAPVQLPIDGTLDLHTFAPKDCVAVVRAYIEEAQAAGILSLRIIHGKGIGTLRQSVHAELSRNPLVEHFRLADESGGGWGATLATLRRG